MDTQGRVLFRYFVFLSQCKGKRSLRLLQFHLVVCNQGCAFFKFTLIRSEILHLLVVMITSLSLSDSVTFLLPCFLAAPVAPVPVSIGVLAPCPVPAPGPPIGTFLPVGFLFFLGVCFQHNFATACWMWHCKKSSELRKPRTCVIRSCRGQRPGDPRPSKEWCRGERVPPDSPTRRHGLRVGWPRR